MVETARTERTEILYVTSFSPDLYEATGKALLASHRALKIRSPFLVCHDGAVDFGKRRPACVHELDRDELLKTWLRDNRDIIPTHLGGEAKECACPERHRRHGRHEPGCHYQWFNRNASRWFRKAVAWYRASRDDVLGGNVRYLIWLDSDCVIKRELPLHRLEKLLAGNGLLYLQGKRRFPETGVVIFDLVAGGIRIIDGVIDHYVSKAFRSEPQWDDCWSLMTSIKRSGVPVRDLVDPMKQQSGHVLPITPLAKYFEHHKGMHGRILDIMK